MEPSSAMSTLVLAVLPGCPTFSATEPATIQIRRARATSRMAPRVGPSSGSAVAMRSSSRPHEGEVLGKPDEPRAQVGRLVEEPDRGGQVAGPVPGGGHLDGTQEVRRRRAAWILLTTVWCMLRSLPMRRFYTTFEAAHVLGVSLPTVVNWIKARRLKAHRTPGGHRRIAREELASFMSRHGMPMPVELADAVDSRRKALVVGEAGTAVDHVVRQLQEAGIVAQPAGPGFAAGLAAARFSPDVVVLVDPPADGGDTLAGLRSDAGLASVPGGGRGAGRARPAAAGRGLRAGAGIAHPRRGARRRRVPGGRHGRGDAPAPRVARLRARR